MTEINHLLSETTININRLNPPIKRQSLVDITTMNMYEPNNRPS